MNSAKSYLDRFWDGILPVNPTAIANGAGVSVIADPGLSLQGLSGRYLVENGAPTIRYSPQEPIVRQRFTIAHELGHHALDHGPSFRDPVAHFSLSNYEPKETQANRFAAELLMPAEAIEYLMSTSTKALTIAVLAQRMQVSQIAMQYRLRNLGWLNRA